MSVHKGPYTYPYNSTLYTLSEFDDNSTVVRIYQNRKLTKSWNFDTFAILYLVVNYRHFGSKIGSYNSHVLDEN